MEMDGVAVEGDFATAITYEWNSYWVNKKYRRVKCCVREWGGTAL